MRPSRFASKIVNPARKAEQPLASGNPERIARRATNKLVGRLIARYGVLASALSVKRQCTSVLAVQSAVD